MKRSRILGGLAAVAATTAMAVLPAGPAQAATPADCPVGTHGPVCVYWDGGYTGTHFAVAYSSTGRNVSDPNSNGSVVNESTGCLAYLWYNTGESGPELTLTKNGTTGDRKSGSGQGQLLNNLRSVSWGC